MTHRNRTRRTDRILALLLCIAAILTPLAACGPHRPQPTPARPKTEKITYPADFVRRCMYDKNIHTPKAVAKDMRERQKEFYTDAYATKNGDVVGIVTEQQRQANIKDNDEWIGSGERTFTDQNPDYHYEVSPDETEMKIWANKDLAPLPGFGIMGQTPLYYGYNYYMKRHTGPWDMRITIYNCHTNQMITTYKFTQTPQINMATLGD
ncbi:hypothetical protein GA0061078_1681 [Bifidobacterium bohemicum]|uniref:Putative mucin-2 n=1 Tax=Bifidobacterium bohemicum DSM 22767 TaxID=1437606 RepID=A0A086ZH91_9BIFI|nr:hypothetical protein [Bifidobacterium bohemicum]KFI45891.1 putative mucin-2 [Bifidobacterium bohemicum DSM 22767]SCC16444.1 hypothetical protein GA0061078_1681 [Bifidobacterium bohemicum]